MARISIQPCFARPVIPVVWDPSGDEGLIGHSSATILQGGPLADLPRVLDAFQQPNLRDVALFVHIDLVAGLENNEAGLEYLAGFQRIGGVVTVHHHLARPARRLGLLSIVRLFLSDSRAVERGLAVVGKSHPSAIEILPAAVAVKVENDFARCPLPRIAGGLCRTEHDVRETLESGCQAVTSTSPTLWHLNQQ